MSRQELWLERRYRFARDEVGLLLFLTAYVGLILINGLTSTALKQTEPQLVSLLTDVRWVLFMLLLAKVVFCSHYTVRGICLVALCVAALALGFVMSHSIIMLENVLLIVAAKDIPFRQLVRSGLKAVLMAFALVFALESVGLLPDTVFIRSGETAVRHTLGFGHPNTLGVFVLTICMMWMVLRFGRLRWWDCAGWLGLAVLLILIADSRTSALMIGLMTFLVWFFSLFGGVFQRHPLLRGLVLLVFPLCMALSIVLCITYNGNNPVMHLVNSIATNRLKWGHLMYQQYGFSLLGQPIQFVSNLEAQLTGAQTHILDNSYMRLPIYFGIVPTVLFLLWFCAAMYHALKRSDWAVVICLLVMATYGLTEAHQINILYNFALLSGAELLTPACARRRLQKE